MKNILFAALLALATPVVQAQSIEQAAILTRNEQYEDAARMLNAMKARKPSAVIHYNEGWNFLKADEIPEALAAFDAAYKLGPKTPEGLIGMGIKLLWEGKPNEAEDHFNRGLLVAKKKRINMLNNIGEAWLTAPKRNVDKALEKLKEATEGGIANPEGYILLGDALWAQNPSDASQPVQNYLLAEDFGGRNVVVAITRQGRVWSKAKVFDRASEDFNRAIAADAAYAPVYREFGDMYYAKGDIQQALKYYRDYLQRNSTPGARRKYISALYLGKQYDEAIKEGEALVQEKPFGNVYGLLAYCLAEKPGSNAADASKGLMYFDKYLSLSPGREPSAFDLYTKSSLLAITGDTASAWKTREEALSKENTKDAWYDELAQWYYKRKAYADAARIYSLKRQFGKKFTNNDMIFLGTSHYYNKDYVNADTTMAEVLKLSPDYQYGWLIRAKSNLVLDTFQRNWAARPFFEKWIEKLKPEETANYRNDLIIANSYLATYWKYQNDLRKAKEYFMKVQLLDPSNAEAKAFLESKEVRDLK